MNHPIYSKLSKLYKLICFIIIITFFVLFLSSLYSCNKFAVTENSYQIDKDTLVQINNNEPETVDLKDYSFDALNKGDTLTIQHKLDTNIDLVHPVMCFLIYHSVIDCYLDDQLIYTYGHDKYENNLSVGSNYFRIPLPEDYKGKTLQIKFTVTEDDAFSSVYNFSLKSERDSYKDFIYSKLFIIIIAIPMFFIGLASLIIAAFKPFKQYKTNNLTFIALFSILVSLWILSNNKVLHLVTNDITYVSDLEYISLYLAPIPLLVFFCNMEQKKMQKKIYIAFAIIFSIFNIVTMFFDLLNIKHYCSFLKIFQFLAVLIGIYLAYTSLKNRKDKSSHEKILSYGIILMMAICCIDILRFNLEKYAKIQNVKIQISLVPLGALILVISFLYSYGIDTLNTLYKNVERQTLIKLAYIDALTQIPNRAKCEEIMNELECKNDKATTIISLDLNNLKYVNDTYGHQSGDHMIFSFASILKDTFNNYGFIARMGGDEFITILQEIPEDKVEELINELCEELIKYNKSTNYNYKLSVAYGYYTRNINSNLSLWKVYEFADKRMYINKKKQKHDSNFSYR